MTDSDDRYVVNVEAAIYRDGEYLLVERAAAEDHAAGTLALVGGTVEATDTGDALEATLRREVREEVAIAITDPQYVQSNAFTTDDGTSCVNVVFLCRHDDGEARVAAPAEVAAVEWLSIDAVLDRSAIPPWTAEFLTLADERRRVLDW
ncbi:NUDIX hydrolase [Halococcus saccharolyticus]|uniref:NUDIX hydrolase n=1 Tax=Halococcus saccharolyticus DSM 5350 TaxID=1227455 RepID=M0MMV5_9EURY|nr:NUDIX domain-containing protein [Halococcus saccharolyticus]EMA45790.1 NUDIX hydrolase [Halococcus saccharolyticus DSM 5350]